MSQLKPIPEQQQWLDEALKKHVPEKGSNPCLHLYGAGPEGEVCKHCALLIRKRMAKLYFKCALRKNTSGPATDHKANWPACAKFKPIPKMDCPRCGKPALFVRDRNFSDGSGLVFTCFTDRCPNRYLYFYPADTKIAPAEPGRSGA